MAKRRANGEGSLRQLENGRWTCQVMVGYKPDGKRDIRTITAKTQREVIKKRDELNKKKSDGTLVAENLCFEEWSDTWFENHKDNITPTTQEGYKYTLRILKDHFGKWELRDIKAMHVEEFLKKLRKDGRSNSALSQCRGMLFQILNKACANDFITKNPVAYADKMRKDPPKHKEAYTMDEVRLLWNNLSQDKVGWSIRLLLCTGMRSQELLGLEPHHIKADGSEINIAQAMVMVKGTASIGTPKSNDSYRTMPIPESARHYARLLRQTEDKFVWESPKKPGQPCNPTYFRKQYYKALETVEGVRKLSPHCCRHTYVSQLQALGVSMETIQSMVGHADIDMTRHYLRVQEPKRQEAIALYDEALNKNGRGVHGNILDYSLREA